MEYRIDTKYDVNDKLYAINNLGEIKTYHIGQINFKGKIDKNSTTIIIQYDIYNSSNNFIATVDIVELQRRYFLSKKDIVKHLMEQL